MEAVGTGGVEVEVGDGKLIKLGCGRSTVRSKSIVGCLEDPNLNGDSTKGGVTPRPRGGGVTNPAFSEAESAESAFLAASGGATFSPPPPPLPPKDTLCCRIKGSPLISSRGPFSILCPWFLGEPRVSWNLRHTGAEFPTQMTPRATWSSSCEVGVSEPVT